MTNRARRRWPLVVAVLGIGLLASVGVLAITWGEPDGEGHPKVGVIVVDGPRGPFTVCTGTLIAPDAFLTAGHCAAYLNSRIAAGVFGVDDVYVSFDTDDPAADSGTWHSVSSIDAHPLYGQSPRRDRAFDIAVLVLSDEITTITPATLPEAGYLDSLRAAGAFQGGVTAAHFTVVGYGSQLRWPPPEIFYGTDRRVATSGYMSLTAGWLFLSQNQAVGNGGTGYGDSGGPTFYSDPELGDVLVSVTSWGDVNTVATGITQRVDLPEVLSFLAGYLD